MVNDIKTILLSDSHQQFILFMILFGIFNDTMRWRTIMRCMVCHYQIDFLVFVKQFVP